MERALRLVIVGLTALIILKTSTFGWKFFTRSKVDLLPKDNSLIDNLKKHIYKISHEIGNRNIFDGYDNLKETADYITEQLRSYGYNVEFQQYTIESKKVENIIAAKEGANLLKEIIVVGAHYDSCFNIGADDNASGVAGMLELARFMADKKNDRTIEFIAFVNEEPPFFKSENMGSRKYARDAKANNKDIKAAIILETIGYYTDKVNSQRYPIIAGIFYPNKGNFIAVIGNFNSRHLANRITGFFKKHSKFPIESCNFGFIPGSDFSDHWSFWQEGYPAVMITDTAFFRNPHYHRNSDTWEKLNYKNLACVIEGFYAVLTGMANFKN